MAGLKQYESDVKRIKLAWVLSNTAMTPSYCDLLNVHPHQMKKKTVHFIRPQKRNKFVTEPTLRSFKKQRKFYNIVTNLT
jgi:hypothetical protein